MSLDGYLSLTRYRANPFAHSWKYRPHVSLPLQASSKSIFCALHILPLAPAISAKRGRCGLRLGVLCTVKGGAVWLNGRP